MLEAVKVLENTKEKINTPDKWTKGTYGIVGVGGYECLCLYGAFCESSKGASNDTIDYVDRTMSRVAVDRGVNSGCAYIKFNDAPNTKHEDVMSLLDEAIEIAKADGN